MSQALYTSKTGIAAGQTQIDVISNNVANINTTAYKAANVTFSTLFSKTLSNGSAATTRGGGTNPRQIGLGAQVASISRNFEPGSFQATGVASDMMISGNGYFVVQDADGNQYLTRDGHFSLDSDGNLTVSNGYRVVGTATSYTNRSGNSTIKVPTQLNATVSGTIGSEIGTKKVSDLNCISLSKGTYTFNVGGNSKQLPASGFSQIAGTDNYQYDPTPGGAAGDEIVYTKLDNNNLSAADRASITSIWGSVDMTTDYYKGADGTFTKGPIPTSGNVTIRNEQKTVSYNISEGDLNGSLQDLANSMTNEFAAQGYHTAGPPQEPTIVFSVVDGGLKLENKTGETLTAADNQQSNFLAQTGLKDTLDAAVAGQTTFYTNDLNQSVVIRNATSYNNAVSRSDWSIGEDGIITASYSDGSSLTVMMGDNDEITWKFKTADNVTITGSGLTGSDIDTSASDLNPANMILQLATVVNDGGLLAQTDNLWSIGPNAGEAYYGVSGSHGMGNLKSGGVEGSNVDMATELSNMIMAQRAIQVNSRVFGTASSILETLAYLGQ